MTTTGSALEQTYLLQECVSALELAGRPALRAHPVQHDAASPRAVVCVLVVRHAARRRRAECRVPPRRERSRSNGTPPRFMPSAVAMPIPIPSKLSRHVSCRQGSYVRSMDLAADCSTSRRESCDPPDRAWFAWVRAHGQARPHWTSSGVVLAFIDPEPLAAPIPSWLLRSLLSDEPVLLRRVEQPPGRQPAFQVLTRSGRDLGRITNVPAQMIDFMLGEGLEPEVSVLACSVDLPWRQALQLILELHAWFAPGEPVSAPVVYDKGMGES